MCWRICLCVHVYLWRNLWMCLWQHSSSLCVCVTVGLVCLCVSLTLSMLLCVSLCLCVSMCLRVCVYNFLSVCVCDKGARAGLSVTAKFGETCACGLLVSRRFTLHGGCHRFSEFATPQYNSTTAEKCSVQICVVVQKALAQSMHWFQTVLGSGYRKLQPLKARCPIGRQPFLDL